MTGKVRYLSIIKLPTYLILLIGRIVSNLGQIFFSMATMWYTLNLTNSPLAAAIIPLVPYLIFALMGFPLATISDRLEKKRILIFTDLFDSLLIGSVGLLMLFTDIQPFIIYIANLFLAISNLLFNPALQTILPNVLPHPEDQLAPANALIDSSIKTVNLIGYSVGGVVIAFFETSTILFFTSFTFFISAILFLIIKIPIIKSTPTGTGLIGFYKDSILGIKFLMRTKAMKTCLILGAVINLFSAPMHIFTSVFSKIVLETDSVGYGYLQSAFTAGAMIGALVSGKLAKRFELRQWFFISFLMTGISLVILPLIPNLFAAVILSTLLMFGTSLINIPLTTYIILSTPNELIGRTLNSFGILVSGVSVPVGLLLGGWLIEKYGPHWIYISIGAIQIIMAIVVSINKNLKEKPITDANANEFPL